MEKSLTTIVATPPGQIPNKKWLSLRRWEAKAKEALAQELEMDLDVDV